MASRPADTRETVLPSPSPSSGRGEGGTRKHGRKRAACAGDGELAPSRWVVVVSLALLAPAQLPEVPPPWVPRSWPQGSQRKVWPR